MADYVPTTETGRALKAIGDELLAQIDWNANPVLKAGRRLALRKYGETIEQIDRAPGAAATALRPLVLRAALAIGITAAEYREALEGVEVA